MELFKLAREPFKDATRGFQPSMVEVIGEKPQGILCKWPTVRTVGYLKAFLENAFFLNFVDFDHNIDMKIHPNIEEIN
jgi:hypothetical protein